MNLWQQIRYVLHKLNRKDADFDLDEEIRIHLDLEIQENLAQGMSPDEARQKAIKRFGSVARTKEKSRVVWGLSSLETFWQDIRFGFRMIAKWPGFSFAVILILALGIGATTATFSTVNAVLLQSLPYPQSDRLMMTLATDGKQDWRREAPTVTGPRFEEWKEQNRVFEQVGGFINAALPVNMSGSGEPDRVRAARATPDLFPTLGVQPFLGRNFLPEDQGRGFFGQNGQGAKDNVVILGYRLWQTRFGGDLAVIGRTIRIESDPCTIIGVMPVGFEFPGKADIWLPVEIIKDRHNTYLSVVGRLKPGITPERGSTEMTEMTTRLAGQLPSNEQGDRVATQVVLVPLREFMIGDVRLSLLIFLGAVGLVMAIVCANVASLLLARAGTRQKEMAIRLSLGASRLRLIRQLLTESFILTFLGGLLGLLLAWIALNVLVASIPGTVPRLHPIEIDRWVLAFTSGISLLTGLLFGLVPAWQASRSDLNETLKEGGNRSTGGRQRLRSLLVISEVALALMLTVGAGLLIKSFTLLRSVELGFDPANVLTAGSTLPDNIYPTTAQVQTYYQQAGQRLSTIPGVTAVGLTGALPLGRTGVRIAGNITIEGEADERHGLFPSKLAVNQDYFRAMGIRLLRGREFNEGDNIQSAHVVVISDSVARVAWPNENPLGKRLDVGFGNADWHEVVGVVEDVKQDDMSAVRRPAVYQSYLQIPASRRWFLSEMTFVIRTSGNPDLFAPAIRREIQSVDKDLPVYNVATMQRVVYENISDPRFYTTLLGSFSALALVLAVVGLYGLISYSVTHRTHELGVRIALGATNSHVFRMIVGQGFRLVIIGVLIGLGGAYELTSLLSSFLYKVKPNDMSTFAGVSIALIVVAIIASYLPARKATRVDPTVALRYE